MIRSDRFSGRQKPKRISDLAQEAGVEDLYEVFYRFLSMAVHGHEFGTQKGKLDEEVDLAMQAIGAKSMAAGHAALRWLLHRERTDNETLRKMLGL